MANRETYYSILGIKENATELEIKKAYRAQSMIYHPDRVGTADEAKFKKVSEAYTALSDEPTRALYDKLLLSYRLNPPKRKWKFPKFNWSLPTWRGPLPDARYVAALVAIIGLAIDVFMK